MKSEIGKTLLTVMFGVVAAIVLFYGVTYLIVTHTVISPGGIEIRRMDRIFASTSYRLDFSTGNEEVFQYRFPGASLYIERDRVGYRQLRYIRMYRRVNVDFEKAERIFEKTKIRFKPIIFKKIMEFKRQKKGQQLNLL